MQRIVCSALRHRSGCVICGVRHFDSYMRKAIERHFDEGWATADQGFVDNTGLFLTRSQAWIVDEAAGQIVRRVGGDGVELYSENLY